MPNVVIVGTQWGDEGKGKVVDLLTRNADIVVRFQGGPNAGHTVVIGDSQTILHQLPSGILHENKTCVIGNGVVLDLETLAGEIEEVKTKGYFQSTTELLISENAHIIMPYHKKIDLSREKLKGENRIGTTGRGIGPAYEDKVSRNGIRVVDIFDDSYFQEKLNANLKEKNYYLENYLHEEPVSPEAVRDIIFTYRETIREYVTDTGAALYRSLKQNKKILFEGAQGTLLDIDHGTYPFVTSSNTSSAQAAIGTGIGPRHLDAIVGIAKAYTTRVGAGPFPTEQQNDIGEYLRNKGGEYGATTGRPRRCGWFDLLTVNHAVRLNSLTHLIITKLDVLSGIETIKVCTGYRCRGRVLNEFPTNFPVLADCAPEFEELEGWSEDLSCMTEYDQLPQAAKKYIAYIEEKTGVPVSMVSVGTRRDQIITRINPFAS